MDEAEIKQRALNFLRNNSLATLATTEKNKPWLANVFYVVDSTDNIYFVSKVDTRHVLEMVQNPNVAFGVYSPESKLGKIKGLQAEGKVSIMKKNEIKAVFDLYDVQFPEAFGEGKNYKDFDGPSAVSRFYKITPNKLYLRDTEAFEGKKEITL